MPYKRTTRGKTQWVAQRMMNGQRMQKVCRTEREAKDWESKALTLLESSKTDTACLIEWADRYLEHCESKHAPKSFSLKKAVYQRFFSKVDPLKPVTSLTPQVALAYFQNDYRSGRSGNAVNRDRKDLLAGYNWGIKCLGLPGPNPFQLVDRFPEKKHPRYVPPLEDFMKVLEAAEEYQDKLMLLTLLHLGARKNEVFRMKWRDLDLKQGKVRLYTRKRKDGSEEYDTMVLHSELKQHLLKWWEERPIKDTEHVFVCLDQHTCNEERYGHPFKHRRHLLAKLCEKAGVTPFGFHGIRHLTASWLDSQKVELRVIQGILRHKSALTTSRYLHEMRGTGEVLEQVMPKVGNLMGGGRIISLEETRRKSA